MRHDNTLDHETFIRAVAVLGIDKLPEDKREHVSAAKLTYGAGEKGLRGVTYFNRWLDDKEQVREFIEVCAQGEENPVQLAGTTLHELGHVLAGMGVGHGKVWKESCATLGLRRVKAAGTNYLLAMFEPDIRYQLMGLIERLEKARPANGKQGYPHVRPKPCSTGVGVRGGASRGVGSGSRLRKYTCMCCGQILRASTDSLKVTHNVDGGLFQLAN